VTATRGYQENFSASDASNHDVASRQRKAKTIIAVVKDWCLRRDLKMENLRVLDVGASTGAIDYFLADHFDEVYGIDIDKPAIDVASKEYCKRNLVFSVGDAMKLDFDNETFDVVVCSHVYEHVPDDVRLMKEMYRVLKAGGIVYFSAGNRYAVMEPHYRLPFLSFPPKWISHLYLRCLNRGKYYYEEHRSYWGLKRLVVDFKIDDYTSKIISDPEKFSAGYMVRSRGLKQRVAKIVVSYFYPIVPGYIWLLEK